MVRTKSIDEDAFTVAAGTPHELVVSGIVLWSTAPPLHLLKGSQHRLPKAESQNIALRRCTKSVEHFYAMVAPYLAPLVQRV